jgi:type I restriction enzyme R subunit
MMMCNLPSATHLKGASHLYKPITCAQKVARTRAYIFYLLNEEQKHFLEYVQDKYVETGVDELAVEKLPDLLILKYQALDDAQRKLGDVATIRNTFVNFQRYLYAL